VGVHRRKAILDAGASVGTSGKKLPAVTIWPPQSRAQRLSIDEESIGLMPSEMRERQPHVLPQ
jgi:hypothetical protein